MEFLLKPLTERRNKSNGSRLVMVNEYVVQQDKKTPFPRPQLDLFEQTNVPDSIDKTVVEND